MGSPEGSSVRTILVVEDEPYIASVCHTVLTNDGFEVDIAHNGVVAQDMIEKKHYVLCLVDIRMPEMNGIELFQWMKDIYPEMANRVIFTTGDVVGGETTRFIEQSGIPILTKPFTPDALHTIVSNNLRHIT